MEGDGVGKIVEEVAVKVKEGWCLVESEIAEVERRGM